ncbi:MAG: hypothetical protein ACRC2H_05645 [Silanimonas sp.]
MSTGDQTYWERANELVRENLDEMNNRADQSLGTANAIINQLGRLGNFQPIGEAPRFSQTEPQEPSAREPALPTNPTFSSIEFQLPAFELIDFNVDDLLNTDNLGNIGGNFNLQLPFQITPPDEPVIVDAGAAPSSPTNLPEVMTPSFDPEAYEFPAPPAYLSISVPEFVDTEVEDFTDAAPDFTDTPPDARLNWSYTPYEGLMLDALSAKVSEMLAGGLGLAPEIEQAQWDRARSREEMQGQKTVDEAFATFDGRGFSMPPGMLAKAVRVAREATGMRVSELNREITIKSAELRVENVRVALERGIALESTLIQQHEAMQRLSFETAKATSDSLIASYNLLVSAYDVRSKVFASKLEAWKAKITLVTQRIEAYKARVDAEQAKAGVNSEMTRAFTAQVQAVSEKIGVFKALVEAEQAKAQIIRARLEAYQSEVQAYTERVKVSFIDYQRYEAAARVEGTKAEANAAFVRAFAETLQAQNAAINAKARAIEAKVQALQGSVAKYQALIEAERARVGAQSTRIQSEATVYSAQVGAFNAQVGLYGQQIQVQSQRISDNLRNALAFYEVQVRQFDAQQTRLIETARLQSEAVRAAGQMAAQLAAGAMAAINVGANLSGSAGVSDSKSRSVSYSYNYNADPEDGSFPAV